ncbi:MAG: thiamine-phosphate kinase [Succinivibrionaceae bacterium]|nr:thiamine-phosphate kinase [Succinivibrionaceae bacterium]
MGSSARQLGEFELIRRHFSGHDRAEGVRLGVGDDCAVLAVPPGKELCVTTDSLHEGIHFFPGEDPFLLGYKSLLVNVSDLAAMGAAPHSFTLSLSLPDSDDAFLGELARGLFSLSSELGMALVGGNTSRGPLGICICAMGLVGAGQAVTRAGARPGDLVYVTGTLGLPGLFVRAGYHELSLGSAQWREAHEGAMHMPPRCALGQSLCGVASAMIDISDGLVGDLGHVLRRSGVGAEIDLGRLPVHPLPLSLLPRAEAISLAAYGGGDYELLVVVPPAAEARLLSLAQGVGVPVARVGRITAGAGLALSLDGQAVEPQRAFAHF